MARKMRKFSDGGALGKYNRRIADIKKDFAKDSVGKSGRALEVLEAKRMQRTADAEDDRAKRMGTDRTATRAAERAAESNLTKTRKYGAPQSVTQEKPVSETKITDSLPTPKMDSSIGKKSEAKPPVRRPTATPPRTNTSASTPTVRTDKGAGTPIAPSKFDSKAFADLKAKAAVGKTVPAFGGTALRGKPGGVPLISRVKADDPARVAKLAEMKRAAEAPGATQFAKDRYKYAVSSGMYAKGGSIKKGKIMKYAKGGSTPPQPTPAERAASAKFRESIKNIKPTPAQGKILEKTGKTLAKGGKAKSFAATKFGAALMKKSADTKGRAMTKKACGGSMKKYAKGGSIDGCAVKGKTKTSMVKMKNGGSC